MRPRAVLAVLLALPLGLVAACSDDDGGITARPDAQITLDTTNAATTTDDRTTTTVDRTTTTADGTTTTETTRDRTTTTEDDDASSTSRSSPSGTYPDAIRDLFVQAFQGQGLTSEQAECVVGVLEERVPYEDLLAGDISAITEGQAELTDAIVNGCDVDPGTLGGGAGTTTG